MADPTAGSAGDLQIPEELKKQFPDLIDLILKSESMNNEERQYWINILPIMTPEQIQNLRDILENEKKQLAEIDKKYATNVSAEEQQEQIEQEEASRKKKRAEREQVEEQFEKREQEQTDALLSKIESL